MDHSGSMIFFLFWFGAVCLAIAYVISPSRSLRIDADRKIRRTGEPPYKLHESQYCIHDKAGYCERCDMNIW